MDGRGVTLTLRTTLRFGSLDFLYTGPVEPITGRTFGRPPHPNVLTGAAGHEAFVRGFSDDVIVGMLGPNPTQESCRLAVYYLTDLAFQASGDGPLGWGSSWSGTPQCTRGQPGLPDDSVTAYVNDLRTTGAAPRSMTIQRARTARCHDPTRECNVCVATASSSSESEPAPHHRGADDQRRARLNELSEARRQLDEELALLHRELGVEAKRRERQPAQGMLVQGQAHEGNDDRRPMQDVPVQDEPRGRTATGASADQLQSSRVVAHLRSPRACRSPTTIDTPMKARMPTPTHHLSSCGRTRT
jgi:hypothetical protein